MSAPMPKGISSKIMNLKFMQRHTAAAAAAKPVALAPTTTRVSAAASTAPAAAANAPAAAASGGSSGDSDANAAAAAASGGSSGGGGRWKLELRDPTANTLPQVVQAAPPPLSAQEAVLVFKPGRRSYGAFNGRLETNLREIDTAKRAAAAELEAAANAAADAEAAAARAAESAALHASADAEARKGVSELEMAERFARYVPERGAPALVELPKDSNPVVPTDVPLRGGGTKRKAGGGGGGGAPRRPRGDGGASGLMRQPAPFLASRR